MLVPSAWSSATETIPSVISKMPLKALLLLRFSWPRPVLTRPAGSPRSVKRPSASARTSSREPRRATRAAAAGFARAFASGGAWRDALLFAAAWLLAELLRATWFTGWVVQHYSYDAIFIVMGFMHPTAYLVFRRLVREPIRLKES